MDRLLSPDLIVLGGGISKRFDQYKKYFSIDTEVKPANMLNNAGMIGAAWYAKNKRFK
ncbi:MAG: hypothetical protein AAFO07_30725 [Bacteroidota bacterium]